MSAIVIDGLNEEDFRRSIENRLREGRTSAAIDRLRAQIAPYARPGGLLPERFLTVVPSDLVLGGWSGLAEAAKRHDLPGNPVTALSICFGWAGEETPLPGPDGRLKPHLETCWYTDSAWPFSLSAREDLLEGYSFYGCAWNGDCVAVDAALWLDGIDDLHGALAALEADLLRADEPDEDGIRAGSLGACLLSALLVQAVADRIAEDGLPRPLCVMAGSNGVYPYFDAPVAGMPDAARRAAEEADDFIEPTNAAIYGARFEVPAPRYSSLLMTSIPRARKRPALVLEESEDDLSDRLAKLRGLNQVDAEAPPAVEPEMPAGILPLEPGRSPLMTKKPHGHAWDFRETMSALEEEQAEPVAEAMPRIEPEALPADVQAGKPAQIDPELPADHEPAPEALAAAPPEAVPLPVPVPEAAPPPGPAFPNLSPDLQQRLEKLVAAKLNPVVDEPEPVRSGPARLVAWVRGRVAAVLRLAA